MWYVSACGTVCDWQSVLVKLWTGLKSKIYMKLGTSTNPAVPPITTVCLPQCYQAVHNHNSLQPPGTEVHREIQTDAKLYSMCSRYHPPHAIHLTPCCQGAMTKESGCDIYNRSTTAKRPAHIALGDNIVHTNGHAEDNTYMHTLLQAPSTSAPVSEAPPLCMHCRCSGCASLGQASNRRPATP